MIRVLLSDDHILVRDALCSVLQKEPDIEIVGQASDGESTLSLARTLLPDVVVLDISLPDINGIEVAHRLVVERPAVRVLALSTYHDRRFVAQMMEAGASGYVSKAAGRDELLQGIRNVAAGKSYLCQIVAAMLAKSMAGTEANGDEARLGKRETEVLLLIAEGKTSAEVGVQLHIATNTVEVHRRNIMRKLNLHNVADLTRYAIREGLVSV